MERICESMLFGKNTLKEFDQLLKENKIEIVNAQKRRIVAFLQVLPRNYELLQALRGVFEYLVAEHYEHREYFPYLEKLEKIRVMKPYEVGALYTMAMKSKSLFSNIDNLLKRSNDVVIPNNLTFRTVKNGMYSLPEICWYLGERWLYLRNDESFFKGVIKGTINTTRSRVVDVSYYLNYNSIRTFYELYKILTKSSSFNFIEIDRDRTYIYGSVRK